MSPARQKPSFRFSPLVRIAVAILVPLFLFAACETTEAVSTAEQERDDIAAYCQSKAKKEKTKYVRREQKQGTVGRDIGVRARQFFNRAYAQCMEGYGVPISE